MSGSTAITEAKSRRKTDMDNAKRAQVLTEALPYIQEYAGKIVVVKYGGNAMKNPELKKAVMGDIVLLSMIGVKVVVVHGGGPEISDMLKKTGKQSEFIDGLRVTDDETMDIVQMVLSGKVGKDLVSLVQSIGGKAIGISGVDAGIIEAKVLDERLGNVGEITAINTKPVLDLLDLGYIPVISTIAGDKSGNRYNINADTAAAQIAGRLSAESMLAMTDIAGLMEDKDDPSTLIPTVRIEQVPGFIERGIISGGMIPKVQSCVEAIEHGVKKVFIIDGRVPHSILMELLTDEGLGTMFI
ncbi:MAG: acetylglutamate kinase [Firmicutes bacterium]|nr:acetylglutamate kinase [Bacillota bacterium]MBR3393791.1 acetylglutamate kinase [Bacillota bacterium]